MVDILKDPHKVKVEFVNQLSNHGFLNGNVNLTFATAQFTPVEGGSRIETDLVVASRLRMDLYVAQQLRDALTALIDANTKPAATEVN